MNTTQHHIRRTRSRRQVAPTITTDTMRSVLSDRFHTPVPDMLSSRERWQAYEALKGLCGNPTLDGQIDAYEANIKAIRNFLKL